jgi:transcriptional regulator with XRE-family HTH domain
MIVDQQGTLQRVAHAVPEARREHGLSQRRLAAISGVSATTIRKLERGGKIDPGLLVRLGAAMVVLDAYRPPTLEAELPVLTQATRTLLQMPERPRLWGP